MRYDARAFLEGLYSAAATRTPGVGVGLAPVQPGCHVQTPRGYLVPDDLPGPWWELYEERAAIREYEGGQAREHAEAEALRDVVARMRTESKNP